MRFRKSVKICKGVKINFSKSGVSTTFGLPGLSVNVGKKGTYLNTGIPGTGLYDRTKLSGSTYKSSTQKACQYVSQTINFDFDDNGNATFFDEYDRIITDPSMIRKIKSTSAYKAERERIMNKKFNEINSETDIFINIHKLSPSINKLNKYQIELKKLKPETYSKEIYSVPEPQREKLLIDLEAEALKSIKSWKFWTLKRLRKDYVDSHIEELFSIKYNEWLKNKNNFDDRQVQIAEKKNKLLLRKYELEKLRLENIISGDSIYIESEINNWLSSVSLPIEFYLQFEYNNENLYIDLDLPEIEDIPQDKATKLANGTVKRKQKTQKDLKNDYIKCIFGLAIFFSSNLFNISPCIKNIIISGYTQRRNTKTGEIQDDYVYSIKFVRSIFENSHLKAIKEPLDFCMQFENRCNLTSTMMLKPIQPFELNEPN